MKRFAAVLVGGFVLLLGTWLAHRAHDPIAKYRFQTDLIGSGEEPATDHVEELFQTKGTVNDYVRLKASLLADRRFENWLKSGDLDSTPSLDDQYSTAMFLKDPKTRQTITLRFG